MNATVSKEDLKLQRRHARRSSLFDPAVLKRAGISALIMLKPSNMMKNPVMFVTMVGSVLTTLIAVEGFLKNRGDAAYSAWVAAILWITVWFANFSEALAEARGIAQTETLRRARTQTPARLLEKDREKKILSSDLKSGDIVAVEAGETIPSDGEIVEGVAVVDESVITGESAPVVREAGGDRSGVTGGTLVVSGKIKVVIAAALGETFLDRMIALVEQSKRQKTPNEIALTILLAAFTLVFLMVTVFLWPMGRYFGLSIDVPTLIALLVCLIPTTIGGLLPAIGIAGIDRAMSANLLAKSGKAVEVAGDVDTLLVDKTGTITVGNRHAVDFLCAPGISKTELASVSALASMGDTTPEGRSVIELAKKELKEHFPKNPSNVEVVPFSASLRMSGLDFSDGRRIRKGAPDAIKKLLEPGKTYTPELEDLVTRVAQKGGTPVVVADGTRALGVIALEDVLKPGIQDRFKRLRAMGLRIVMMTGDNPLTAKSIAEQAGVDETLAQAKPEDKLAYIRKEQAGGRLVAMMGDGTNDAPALAQADCGVAMNSGTQAAKEAGNMVDLDSDPTKLIEVVEIGKQLLMTRGAITTFSVANDVAKYFAIIPAIFIAAMPELGMLNVMALSTPKSAILSALIFNAMVIPALIPIALRGVRYRPLGANAILKRNLLIYGLGGMIVPFVGIKLIDRALSMIGVA